MALARTLTVRGITLLGVLIAVILLVVVILGATGVSDRMLTAIMSEELRGLRQSLAQTIRDPTELEGVLAARKRELIEFYGLDDPWYFRLPSMMVRVVVLDLGSARTLKSFEGSSLVSDIVFERLGNTLALLGASLAISGTAGILLGVKLATKVGSRLDRVFSYLSAVSFATPTWWLGILLILALSFNLRLLPSQGMLSAPPPNELGAKVVDLAWHGVLPTITLSLASVGGWTFAVRTMVVNTAQEDFVNVARAKGIPERLVMSRHILRVAAPPIVTNIILGLAGAIGGAVLTETVFNWPGMGRLYFNAILALDESVIIALTFMFTLVYVAARFILEVLYIMLDPRVRY